MLLNPLLLLLAILGAYRLSHMIAIEDGPFDVFAMLRERIGQKSWIGRGLHCPLCISFWVSALFAPTAPDMLGQAFYWLGVAGGCLALHKLLYREES